METASQDRRFVKQYEDVLQNIEFGIVQVYRAHPELTDWEVLTAVEALIREYQAESKGRSIEQPALLPLAEEVYHSAGAFCEWRLGRAQMVRVEDDEPVEGPPPITLSEIVACLKRIRRSIEFWSKQGGRQGYLRYVSNFLP